VLFAPLWSRPAHVVQFRPVRGERGHQPFPNQSPPGAAIQLPGIDGYETTRRLKADTLLRAIPIIAVTSYALTGEAETARAAGCDGYIPKPYSPRQLLAKVREYLSSPAAMR
jgi:DNA-binding NarL/FixJ family response regulator